SPALAKSIAVQIEFAERIANLPYCCPGELAIHIPNVKYLEERDLGIRISQPTVGKATHLLLCKPAAGPISATVWVVTFLRRSRSRGSPGLSVQGSGPSGPRKTRSQKNSVPPSAARELPFSSLFSIDEQRASVMCPNNSCEDELQRLTQ